MEAEFPFAKQGRAGVKKLAKKATKDGSVLDGLLPSTVEQVLAFDSEGKLYSSLEELWAQEAGSKNLNARAAESPSNPKSEASAAQQEAPLDVWHSKGLQYWQAVEPTVEGVLAGFQHVHKDDCREAFQFLKSFFEPKSHPPSPSNEPGRPARCVAPLAGSGNAVDVGGGIGRTKRGLLKHFFARVDLVDNCRAFLDRAEALDEAEREASATAVGSYEAKDEEEEIQNEILNVSGPNGGKDKREFYFCASMRDWIPGRPYDCIWMQWVAGHLPDAEFVAFLRRCVQGLTEGSAEGLQRDAAAEGAIVTVGGIIVVKENNSDDGQFEVDREDSCITRSDLHFRLLFARAGLVVVRSTRQHEWPEELLPCSTYALRPYRKSAQASAQACSALLEQHALVPVPGDDVAD